MEVGTPAGGERDGAIGDCTAIEDEGVMRIGEIKLVRTVRANHRIPIRLLSKSVKMVRSRSDRTLRKLKSRTPRGLFWRLGWISSLETCGQKHSLVRRPMRS